MTIRSVTDLSGKSAPFTDKNPAKGIIGVGARSGCFTVVCEVDTGQQAPEVLSEEKNWEWRRDAAANIVGMLSRRCPPTPGNEAIVEEGAGDHARATVEPP